MSRTKPPLQGKVIEADEGSGGQINPQLPQVDSELLSGGGLTGSAWMTAPAFQGGRHSRSPPEDRYYLPLPRSPAGIPSLKPEPELGSANPGLLTCADKNFLFVPRYFLQE